MKNKIRTPKKMRINIMKGGTKPVAPDPTPGEPDPDPAPPDPELAKEVEDFLKTDSSPPIPPPSAKFLPYISSIFSYSRVIEKQIQKIQDRKQEASQEITELEHDLEAQKETVLDHTKELHLAIAEHNTIVRDLEDKNESEQRENMQKIKSLKEEIAKSNLYIEESKKRIREKINDLDAITEKKIKEIKVNARKELEKLKGGKVESDELTYDAQSIDINIADCFTNINNVLNNRYINLMDKDCQDYLKNLFEIASELYKNLLGENEQRPISSSNDLPDINSIIKSTYGTDNNINIDTFIDVFKCIHYCLYSVIKNKTGKESYTPAKLNDIIRTNILVNKENYFKKYCKIKKLNYYTDYCILNNQGIVKNDE